MRPSTLRTGKHPGLPGSAQTGKDSPAAAATRKRLKEKISVEVKNEMLRDVFKEIAGKLEELKKGSLSQTNEQGTGINMNTRITVVAKDKPVEEILDEMLKPLELGYIVVSKPGDRTDGFQLIKKGNLRKDKNDRVEFNLDALYGCGVPKKAGT